MGYDMYLMGTVWIQHFIRYRGRRYDENAISPLICALVPKAGFVKREHTFHTPHNSMY